MENKVIVVSGGTGGGSRSDSSMINRETDSADTGIFSIHGGTVVSAGSKANHQNIGKSGYYTGKLKKEDEKICDY